MQASHSKTLALSPVQRLDAGLFTLQLVDYIMAVVIVAAPNYLHGEQSQDPSTFKAEVSLCTRCVFFVSPDTNHVHDEHSACGTACCSA